MTVPFVSASLTIRVKARAGDGGEDLSFDDLITAEWDHHAGGSEGDCDIPISDRICDQNRT